MANTTTTAENAEVKQLKVEARFVTKSFPAKDDNGNDIQRDYVVFELINAFGDDEDFQNIALKAKWDKYDEKTNRLVRPDRVFGWMTYYAKKALKTASEVKVNVTIKPVTYQNKSTKEMVTYAGIFADPTFVELEGEKDVEMVVKNANDRNIFALLAGKALGLKLSPRPDDEE